VDAALFVNLNTIIIAQSATLTKYVVAVIEPDTMGLDPMVSVPDIRNRESKPYENEVLT
jgi:hypothetical protein